MIKSIADISIVGLQGEVGSFEGERLLRNLANLIRHRWNKIILDLGEVEHIHYRILAELGIAVAGASPHSGSIKLANLSSYHRELLKVAGVESCFETYDSVAEAVLSFQGDPPTPCELH